MPVTSRVPLISGQIPYWGSAKVGVHSLSVMKLVIPTSPKKRIVSLRSA